MIEVIYKEEKQEAKNGENLFNLPRNIRQVGLTTGNMRIYIEDYVYTFLTRLARNAVGSGKEQGCVAVFTGETKWNNGITYLFIRGALMVEDMEAASDHIDFSEKIWAKIQEDQAKYFPGQEITGWFFSRPQMYMETDELLTRIHLRYFGGEKVLMLMEPAEKEEAFFFFENGKVARIPLNKYQTVTRRKKLTGAYSDKSPLKTVLHLQGEGEIAVFSTEGRALIVNTEMLAAKSTRTTQGVAVLTLKPKWALAHAARLEDTTIVNKARYRGRTLPSAGALLKPEDRGEVQLTFT